MYRLKIYDDADYVSKVDEDFFWDFISERMHGLYDTFGMFVGNLQFREPILAKNWTHFDDLIENKIRLLDEILKNEFDPLLKGSVSDVREKSSYFYSVVKKISQIQIESETEIISEGMGHEKLTEDQEELYKEAVSVLGDIFEGLISVINRLSKLRNNRGFSSKNRQEKQFIKQVSIAKKFLHGGISATVGDLSLGAKFYYYRDRLRKKFVKFRRSEKR